jgi:hypothetical protein
MKSLPDMLFEISLSQGRYSHELSIARHQTKIYSENGKDGVISTIFFRIGTQDRFFVEFGSGSGVGNNTRLLLEQGWKGVWIDGSEEDGANARKLFENFIETKALRVVHRFVTAETVNALLNELGVPKCVDFHSVDIDRNTGHVWNALTYRCRVACVEYNASLPPSAALQAPYQPDTVWDGSNWFGASLKALELIAAHKRMSLVGCEFAGINAFFVDSSEAKDRFQQPFTAEVHYEPPRYRIGIGGHPPSGFPRKWQSGR